MRAREEAGRHPGGRVCCVAASLTLLACGWLIGDAAASGPQRSLAAAAAAGDLGQVLSLLRSGAPLNARDAQGQTALLRAASAGHLDVVRVLIDAKADIDAADRNGLSPLVAAAARDDVEMARVLLAAGADAAIGHRAYGRPLDIAERQGYAVLAALLRAHGARGSGASVGDTVCVRPWKGQGYCGKVSAVEKDAWTLRVTRLVGCEKGCAPDACSMGRTLGGRALASVQVDDEMRVASACVTSIGLTAEEK
jgi:hypothetical protein